MTMSRNLRSLTWYIPHLPFAALGMCRASPKIKGYIKGKVSLAYLEN